MRKSKEMRQSAAVMLCAVPPAIRPTCAALQGGSNGAASGGRQTVEDLARRQDLGRRFLLCPVILRFCAATRQARPPCPCRSGSSVKPDCTSPDYG
jgi:hypothetical protein